MNLNNLKGHIPDNVIAQIPNVIKTFKIDTTLRMAHFLSQCYYESGGFIHVTENLNYSAISLKCNFPKHFLGNLADSYAKKPEKIASRIYGGRLGNGPEATREGFKYLGRGYIQLTGKDNYKAFSDSISVDCINYPELVATKYPLASAAWFFTKCLEYADLGNSYGNITSVTECVNGGTKGLNDRVKLFDEFYKLLNSEPTATPENITKPKSFIRLLIDFVNKIFHTKL